MKKFIFLTLFLFLSGCGAETTPQVNNYGLDPNVMEKLPPKNVVFPKSDTTTSTASDPIPTSTLKSSRYMNLEIKENKTYTAILHTSEGNIEIALTAKETPITVNNFVKLARKDYYDNTIFHRVIKNFMIQGGDPEGTGRGGPGYEFDDEPFTGEYTRGTLAMANRGPNTNGSQFFILHKDYPLPKKYVIFGHVVKGMEVVDKIATAEVQSGGEGSKPVNPVKVTNIEILEK